MSHYELWLILWVFLWYSRSLWLLQSFPSFFYGISHYACLWVSTAVSIICSQMTIELDANHDYSRIYLGLISWLFFAIHVWFYYRSLGSSTSGPWTSTQHHGWAPSHSMSLKQDQLFVGYSHNFCTIFTPVHLVGRKICKLKVFGWVGVSIPPLEVFPGYRRWLDQYPSLLGVLARITLINSQEFPFLHVSSLFWSGAPPVLVVFTSTLFLRTPNLIPLISFYTPTPATFPLLPLMPILFSLLSKIHMPQPWSLLVT